MYYILKINAGSHYMTDPKTKALYKVTQGQTFKSNSNLADKFGVKFSLISTVSEGSCKEGELFKVHDLSTPKAKETPKVEVEAQVEEVTGDNSVTDIDGTDADDDTVDEVVDEDVEEDSDDDEEEIEFTLPMKLDQKSERKFNVLDANGVKVNDKQLSRKAGNALIKSYKEA